MSSSPCGCGCGEPAPPGARYLHNHYGLTRRLEEGARYDRLVVVAYSGSARFGRGALYACRCDCGETCEVLGSELRRGRKRSCGCLQRETQAANLLRAQAVRLQQPQTQS